MSIDAAQRLIEPSPVTAVSSDAAVMRSRPHTQRESSPLSYKFQRLREKIRQAVTSGELSGKLPGERILARRFHVNAKTLSKALTDLAAEGLLERSIGRGTYVKGQTPKPLAARRWLLVCNAEQAGWETVDLIRQAHPELDIVTDISSLRPSFLNQFSAVICLALDTPDEFVRSLVVRSVPVVVVGQEPRTFSTHAVVFDGPAAVIQAARELLLQGHFRLGAIDSPHSVVVTEGLRTAAARFSPTATVDCGHPADAPAMVAAGVTGFVCQSGDLAREVSEQFQRRSIAVPGDVSLIALGCAGGDPPCTGFFINRREKAAAVVQLLNDPAARPATIWLAGHFIDRGTLAPVTGDLSFVEPADALTIERH